MTKRFMSGRDFKAARKLFEERGIGMYALAELLQCSPHQGQRWQEIGAPRSVALAITAILEDRPPWKPGLKTRRSRRRNA